jgi:VIT1/CCC1 family predicted Fe2+/Mn2+ transporter
MWLKVTLVLLFFAMLFSLTSGFVFLLKDAGISESKRTLYALGVRVSIAVVFLTLIWYGYYSGILTNNAPWAGKY